MEEFISKMNRSKAKHTEVNTRATPKTTRATDASNKAKSLLTVSPPSPASPEGEGPLDREAPSVVDYKLLAIEVAKLICPDIQETLALTVAGSMRQLQEEVAQHGDRLDTIEHDIEKVSTECNSTSVHVDNLIKDNKKLWERIEDLENRSRRNNLRIIGVPESYMQKDLRQLCEVTIPSALGISHTCKVERAHRLGPDVRAPRDNMPSTTRMRPRPVIVKYLDYTDKSSILRNFKSKQNILELGGQKILIFADFSLEVQRKRKAFSPICSALYKKQQKFALLYPAVLKVYLSDGRTFTFYDPERAERELRIPSPKTSPARWEGDPSHTTTEGRTRLRETSGSSTTSGQQSHRNGATSITKA